MRIGKKESKGITEGFSERENVLIMKGLVLMM